MISCPTQSPSLCPSASAVLLADQFLQIRRRLVVYFERRARPNADDLADECILRLVRMLAKEEPRGDLAPVAYGIARLVLLESFRESARFVELNGNEPAEEAASMQQSDRREHALHVIGLLSPEERELLEAYFIDREPAATLSKRYRLTPAGFRSRVFRLKARLAPCTPLNSNYEPERRRDSTK